MFILLNKCRHQKICHSATNVIEKLTDLFNFSNLRLSSADLFSFFRSSIAFWKFSLQTPHIYSTYWYPRNDLKFVFWNLVHLENRNVQVPFSNQENLGMRFPNLLTVWFILQMWWQSHKTLVHKRLPSIILLKIIGSVMPKSGKGDLIIYSIVKREISPFVDILSLFYCFCQNHSKHTYSYREWDNWS